MSRVRKDLIKLTQVNSPSFSAKLDYFDRQYTNFFSWRNTCYETKRGLDNLYVEHQ